MKSSRRIVLHKRALEAKPVATFQTKVEGRIIHGLVARVGTRYFAYQNLCKHVPVTLDCADGDVTTHDGKQIQCQMHGAIYEMETGDCTAGPCVGARLNRFDLYDDGDRVIVVLPEQPELT